jgi:hypothetical protein
MDCKQKRTHRRRAGYPMTIGPNSCCSLRRSSHTSSLADDIECRYCVPECRRVHWRPGPLEPVQKGGATSLTRGTSWTASATERVDGAAGRSMLVYMQITCHLPRDRYRCRWDETVDGTSRTRDRGQMSRYAQTTFPMGGIFLPMQNRPISNAETPVPCSTPSGSQLFRFQPR